ncbi:MAG: universal stress protein [Pseudomonadota bacterium]|nr:universal stress protein [Pseudomonadota bacterium]
MFKRILLPTDGSELAQRAVLAGIGFAKELGAEVIGMTVVPKFHTFTYKAEMVEETQQEYALHSAQRADQYLAAIGEAASRAGVPCSTEKAVSDDPYQMIISTAHDRHCDLIVMGSHGRRGVKGVLLGSETQKVLVHSSVPVLVYR